MMRRVLLALAACVAIVACSGGGDDDDDGNTPTPTPVNVDYCQVVWVTQEPQVVVGTTSFDIFLVDAPLAAWTTGTKNYTVNAPLGVFYDGRITADEPARNAAVTTSGVFGLVLGNGTTTAGSVLFDDDTIQTFYSLDEITGDVGAKVGTGGTGDFSGVWSDPDIEEVEGGTGLITIVYQGTSLQLGTVGSFAKCYDRTTSFRARSAGSMKMVFEALR